jgi:hypothetical protein
MEAFNTWYSGGSVRVTLGVRGVLMGARLTTVNLIRTLVVSVILIKIWTRGQILAKKSTFSELLQNKREHSPRHQKSNATRFVSNGRREREI